MSRILIIEDDTDINNMMAEALRKAGYECTQAFSGTEGLLYIERDAFDLAVLDLMLPGMNGEALLPQIKAGQNVPVIVVSAKDSIDSKVGLLTSGAEDYLTKPFDIQEFIARVGRAVLSGTGASYRFVHCVSGRTAGGADKTGVQDPGASAPASE